MDLVILRHATAHDHSSTGKDADRALMEEGKAEAEAAGRFLRAIDWRPGQIWFSPYRRTRETAELAVRGLGGSVSCEAAAFLASGMRVESALEALRGCADTEKLILVGHQPDLGGLIAHLTGLPGERVRVPKASLWRLEVFRWGPAGAQIRFMMPPKAIRRLAG